MSSQSHSTLHKTSTCELLWWWEGGSCSCLDAVKGGVNLMMSKKKRTLKVEFGRCKICFWLIWNAQFFRWISKELRVECEGHKIYDYCDRAQLKYTKVLSMDSFLFARSFCPAFDILFFDILRFAISPISICEHETHKTHIFSWISWWM